MGGGRAGWRGGRLSLGGFETSRLKLPSHHYFEAGLTWINGLKVISEQSNLGRRNHPPTADRICPNLDCGQSSELDPNSGLVHGQTRS